MQSIKYSPKNHSRHWIEKYSKFKIPLPPLEIQKEIVKILDKFTAYDTELQAELQAELQGRLKQYEHYRDELLLSGSDTDFSGRTAVKLSDVANYSKASIDAKKISSKNYVGVDNLLSEKRGKIDSQHVPETGRLMRYQKGDVLIGNIRPYLRKIWFAEQDGAASPDVLIIHPNNSCTIASGYLYHILSSERFCSYNNKYARGAKMPRGNKERIMEFEFYLPPLEVQYHVISILDKFNRLCCNISTGLPAEIKKRQQQYEYYRDKLLDFPEKK